MTKWIIPQFISRANHEAYTADYIAALTEAEEMTSLAQLHITKIEAQLTIALSGLHECEQEIDDYIRQEYPHDHPVQERYRQRDFLSNPARVTLTELKGTDQ